MLLNFKSLILLASWSFWKHSDHTHLLQIAYFIQLEWRENLREKIMARTFWE